MVHILYLYAAKKGENALRSCSEAVDFLMLYSCNYLAFDYPFGRIETYVHRVSYMTKSLCFPFFSEIVGNLGFFFVLAR